MNFMVLGLKITCTCHPAKIAVCCRTPLDVPIAPKTCTEGISTWADMLNPNLKSVLLFDHSRHTSSTQTIPPHNTNYLLTGTCRVILLLFESSSDVSILSVHVRSASVTRVIPSPCTGTLTCHQGVIHLATTGGPTSSVQSEH